MTMLDVFKDVCSVIGLAVPGAVFGSTEREHVELQALANEMGKRIAFDTHDWTRLKALGTLTGDGVATTFSYPSDFKRMLKVATLWPSASPYAALTQITDSDQWLAWTVQSYQPLLGAWTLIGSTIAIKPAVANGSTVKFYYLSNKIAVPADLSGDKAAFTLDTDTFALDERVLKLGMIWQWLASKGRPYAEHMANYETAVAMQIGADRGPRILSVGRRRFPYDLTYAFPGVLGS